MAAYNAEATIREAVESAVSQVPPPLEVIVCDDGSAVDPAPLLADLPTVRVLRNDHRGEASAKSAAAQVASGDFVVILDSDDVFLPGRIEALGELARVRPDLDLLTTDAWFTNRGVRLRRCYEGNHTFPVMDQDVVILRRNFVFGLAAIRRTRLAEVGFFDSSITHSTDWHCWIRLLLAGVRVGCVMEPLAEYRLHEGAMNADRVAMLSGRLASLKDIERRRSQLSDSCREALDWSLEKANRDLQIEELFVGLKQGDTDSRASGWKIARSAKATMKTRLFGAAVALAPGVVGRVLVRRDEKSFRSVGGIRLERASRSTASH